MIIKQQNMLPSPGPLIYRLFLFETCDPKRMILALGISNVIRWKRERGCWLVQAKSGDFIARLVPACKPVLVSNSAINPGMNKLMIND